MISRLLYTFVILVLLPSRLLAWGHAGHTMVAELAMSMLGDATRVKVERVLGGIIPEQAGLCLIIPYGAVRRQAANLKIFIAW